MLLSAHNIHFLLELTRNMRQAILEDRFTSFKKEFYQNYYEEGKY